MNAQLHVLEKPSFVTSKEAVSRKSALAAALGLALLAAGCGGGGETNVPQAAGIAAGEQQVNADAQQVNADARQADGGQESPAASGSKIPDASVDEELAAIESEADAEASAESAPQKAAMLLPSQAPLGVNLEGLWDWARLNPFVDLMKASRPWGTVDAPWDESAPVDARGWPTGDAAVVVNVRTVEPGDEGRAYRFITPGVYKLKFLGKAKVDTSSSTNVTLRNVQYFASTNTTTADVVVGANANQLMLAFRNTGGGVRNVSLRMPGYTDAAMFNNQFKQAVAPFKIVRFMDFLRTNNNPIKSWRERTAPSAGSQASPKGAAYEYAIALGNQLRKDIWINIPFGADEAYVRSLAQLLKQKVKPGRVVYVEYSNELWNFQFSQSSDNMNAAVNEAVAGDTTLTNGQKCTRAMFDAGTGECNPYWAGYRRVGKKAWEVAQVFKEVYGADAINNTVRVVYATQFANPGIAEDVLANIAKYRGAPKSMLYGVATAPYFYLSEELAASESAGAAEMLQDMQRSLRNENEKLFAAGLQGKDGSFVRKAYTGGLYTGATHKALADFYGIKSVAYEGGPDLRQNPANQSAKIQVNRSAQMGEMVKSEITQWFGCGNDVFMHFSLSSAWDRYGYWGLTNDPTNLQAAKYKAAKTVAMSDKASFTTCN